MHPLLIQHLEQLPGRAGWAALNLSTGQTQSYNSRRFLAASTIKLPVLCLYALERQQAIFAEPYLWDPADWVEDSPLFEGLKPGDTVSWDTLAEWMMIRSDNAATNLLIKALGLERIQSWIAEQGLKETFLQRLMMDSAARVAGRENWTSPSDMLQLMAKLVQGQLLPAAASQWVLDILFRCEDPEKIPYLFEVPVRVANKPGELPGNRSDVGYVVSPEQEMVMALFVDGLPDEAAEQAADLWLAQLAQYLWQNLQK